MGLDIDKNPLITLLHHLRIPVNMNRVLLPRLFSATRNQFTHTFLTISAASISLFLWRWILPFSKASERLMARTINLKDRTIYRELLKY